MSSCGHIMKVRTVHLQSQLQCTRKSCSSKITVTF